MVKQDVSVSRALLKDTSYKFSYLGKKQVNLTSLMSSTDQGKALDQEDMRTTSTQKTDKTETNHHK